ncbi:hypothetical protein C0J52_05567 [Blattella germanica]|nr:hypothetical protein C0J52_05567 [Blattella germanica]PSN44782.1 hypothetical protein C0J52_05567 [Blattella germanica]
MIQAPFAVALIIALVTILQATDQPTKSFLGCLSNRDCAATQCCRAGIRGNLIYYCDNLGRLGSYCNPDNNSKFTIVAPDGQTAHLTTCGCAEGLQCNNKTSTCQTRTSERKNC